MRLLGIGRWELCYNSNWRVPYTPVLWVGSWQSDYDSTAQWFIGPFELWRHAC